MKEHNYDNLFRAINQEIMDNKKLIKQNDAKIEIMRTEVKQRHEEMMYWLTKPWWKKLFGIK